MHESAREMRPRSSTSFAVAPVIGAPEVSADLEAASLLERVRPHWPVGVVFGAFLLSMFIVPTLANVTISDDWVYQWSVRLLVEEHKLQVHPLVSSHLVFQVLWGGLFGEVFGVTPGVMRLSIVVLWLLSGLAFYGLAWEFTGKRALSAIGTTAYLFNPLGYVLAFTFMTDAPFTALLVISMYCTVRGLRHGFTDGWIIAGSGVSALAILERQPGLFIPVGVLGALVLTRQLWFNVRSYFVALEVGVLPVAAYAAYSWWLHHINGVPVTQTVMQDELLQGGWTALGTHTERLAAIEAIYLGMFVLPLVAGAVIGLRRLLPGVSSRAWVAFVIWQTLVIAGFFALRALGMRMPYIPHFMSIAGLGPNDLLYARWPIAGRWLLLGITVLCTASTVGAGFLVVRALDVSRRSAGLSVILATFAVQAGAVIIVSTHFRYWMIGGVPSPSLDRYLLPLLPLALVTLLWAVRNIEVHLPLAWYVAVVLAVFAVAGTRDNLSFHQAQWDVAQAAVDSGIPLTQLDAGASWTGSHVGERSYLERGITAANPWWLGLYGSLIDPQYVVSTVEVTGFTTVSKHPYSLWLDTRPTALYLLHRDPPPKAP